MKSGEWSLLFHRCLLEQLERLKAAADRAFASDPLAAMGNANVKLYDALAKLMLETVPDDPARDEYRQGNTMGPEFRVSLLNLDADLYVPTKTALTYLIPRMSSGGVVILDEYDVPDFPGEKQAVIDYFGHNMPVLRDFYWCKNPSRYFFA